MAQVHFDAGYVPAHHSVAAFAQALRAVGEPVFGRSAADVSMGRLLTQLFEITALFDMRLRPELILLQKTMVAVEGVARRIDPSHDIWAAADPIVRRYIARELSPIARARDFLAETTSTLKAIARRLEEPPPAPPPPLRSPNLVPVVLATPSRLDAGGAVGGGGLAQPLSNFGGWPLSPAVRSLALACCSGLRLLLQPNRPAPLRGLNRVRGLPSAV